MAKENNAATMLLFVAGILGLGLVIARTKETEEKAEKVGGEEDCDCPPDGESRGKTAADYDPAALAKGTLVEMEHTTDPKVAQRIAMDHLEERGDYYERLEEAEL